MTRTVNVVTDPANYVLTLTLDDGRTTHYDVAPETLLAEPATMALIRHGNTWVEPTPATCPNGDTLGPNRVTISWDGTQRTYRCATCDHTWAAALNRRSE